MPSSTVSWLFASAAATNGDGSITGSAATATNLTTFTTNVTTYAYTGSPVCQIATASTSAALAVTNNRYIEVTLTKPAGTASWAPTSMTMNWARGGSATPRGFQVRHSANSYASDLPGGGDVTTQRTTWNAKTITLTSIGTITGNLTLRIYPYAPTTSATLESDSWILNYDYTAAGGGGSAPVADFTATPLSGTAPLAVQFTDASTNTPTSWSWTFGDGGTSTSQNPQYTYNTAGTYTVELTATNATGSDVETKTGYVTVSSGGGGGTPAIVQSSTSRLLQTLSGTSHTHTFGSPATAGNLLYTTIGVDKSSGTITAPSGWTLIGSSVGTSVSAARAYRIATGGETSLTWTWATTADVGVTFSEWNITGAALMGTPVTSAASETTVASITVTGTAATGNGIALAGVSIDTGAPLNWVQPGDPTWTDGYTLAVKEPGVGDASAESNGGACSAVGYKILTNGTATTTTMAWSQADQASAFLDKFSYTGVAGGGGTGVAIDSAHSGLATTTTQTIAVDGPASGSIRIRYSTDPTFATSSFSSAVTADATRGIAKVDLTGLSPNTVYYYRVQVDAVDSTNGEGKFKTAPTAGTSYSRKIAFSSCRDTNTNSTVFDRIAARNPDVFLVMGDWHYQDINSTTAATYHSAYDEWQQQTRIRSLLLNTEHLYIWSDHDYCGNASHGGSTGASTVRGVYKNRMAHITHPNASGIYGTATLGDARIILLDTRSFRSPPGNTDNSSKVMLGATQEQWFKDTLAAATEPIIFVVSDVPWIPGGTQDDHWGSYQTEQNRLVAAIPSATWNKVIWLCGDAHMLAYDNGSNSPGGSPVWHAAALDRTGSTKGGPYSGGSLQGGGQYGIIDLVSNGTTLTATYSGINSSDGTWGTHQVSKSLSAPPDAHTGSLSLSGDGSLNRSASPGFTQALGTSGDGSLTRSGTPRPVAALGTSGAGTLTSSAVPRPVGSLGTSGAGTVSPAGSPRPSGAVALAGAGTLGTSGAINARNTLATAGSGTITAAGTPATSGTLGLAGAGSAAPAGSPGLAGSTALSGSGALATTGSLSIIGPLALSGVGTWQPSASQVTTSGTLGRTGDGALTVSGEIFEQGAGSLALSGSGELMVAGSALAVSGVLFLSGDGEVEGAGSPATSGALGTSGGGSLAPTPGGGGAVEQLNLSGAGSLGLVANAPAFAAHVGFAGGGGLELDGGGAFDGAVGFTGAGALGVVGGVAGSGSLALAGSGVLVGAPGGVGATGQAAFAGEGAVGFGSVVSAAGALGLSGSGGWSSVGSPGSVGEVLLTGSGALVVGARRNVTVAVSLGRPRWTAVMAQRIVRAANIRPRRWES